MKLYTCGQKKRLGHIGHPCGRAAIALDEAGHEYELVVVPGYKNIPFAMKDGDRAEIEALTGQKGLPVLQLDDGSTIVGSGTIVGWARVSA